MSTPFKLSKREVFILEKAIIQLKAAEIARNFDKSECKYLDELEELSKKLADYGGEDE